MTPFPLDGDWIRTDPDEDDDGEDEDAVKDDDLYDVAQPEPIPHYYLDEADVAWLSKHNGAKKRKLEHRYRRDNSSSKSPITPDSPSPSLSPAILSPILGNSSLHHSASGAHHFAKRAASISEDQLEHLMAHLENYAERQLGTAFPVSDDSRAQERLQDADGRRCCSHLSSCAWLWRLIFRANCVPP